MEILSLKNPTSLLIVALVVHRKELLLQQTSSKVQTLKIPRDAATCSSSIRNQPDKQLLLNHWGQSSIRMKSWKSLRNSRHGGAVLGGDLLPVQQKLEGSRGTADVFTFDLPNLTEAMIRSQIFQTRILRWIFKYLKLTANMMSHSTAHFAERKHVGGISTSECFQSKFTLGCSLIFNTQTAKIR